MTTKSIPDLTSRLALALDQNYDVVNMDIVLSVISALEGTPITKEQLEATRLAKYINALRRRTSCDHLARRAKSLLKKWREMVGIQHQQQAYESTNATDSSCALIAQSDPCSQPITPILHIASENSRSTKSNPQISSLHTVTSISNINVAHNSSTVSNVNLKNVKNMNSNNANNYNKRHEKSDLIQDIPTNATLPLTLTPKQPTSFANLLNDIYNENRGVSCPVLPNSNTNISTTDIYYVDQSSNSNSTIISNPLNAAPIVINIQDSNSGSNHFLPKTPFPGQHVEKNAKTPAEVKFNKGTSKNLYNATRATENQKQKKSKKDKKNKRKERDNFNDNSSTSHSTILINHDESSTIPQNLQSKMNMNKFTSILEEKSQGYPASNISEILSLSNSSMSSLFPGEAIQRVNEERNRLQCGAGNNNHRHSTTDLTFAGKFKQQITPITPNPTDTNTSNGSIEGRTYTSLDPTKQRQLKSNKFILFSGNGCNSNESSNSNSRISQYEIINMENNESRKNENNRSNKKDSIAIGVNNLLNNRHQKNNEDNLLIPTITAKAAKLSSKLPFQQNNGIVISIDDNKIPKKRGRKKGSKGVDSVIAKETSLSSQMLITSLSSGNKKVKTTKELYAEMQNRKLGVSSNLTSPSLTLPPQALTMLSRSASSCSEPSISSPTALDAGSNNVTLSTTANLLTTENNLNNHNEDCVDSDDSCTITTEHSHDSVPSRYKSSTIRDSVESNSIIQLNYTKSLDDTVRNTKQNALTGIETELRELLKQLPMPPTIKEIEEECAAETIVCTCHVEELSENVYDNKLTNELHSFKIESAGVLNQIEKPESTEENQLITINVKKNSDSNQSCLSEAKSNPCTQKPKKSIFDLDFDDDEDPLYIIKAETMVINNVKQENDVKLNCELTKKCTFSKMTDDNILDTFLKNNIPISNENDITHSTPNEVISADGIPILPKYHIVEDPECEAKKRFEVQTQEITQFHVNALHNCYIPNINGNWDNADTSIDKCAKEATLEALEIQENSCSNGFSIVPKYGLLSHERIRKDLSDVIFTKKYRPKRLGITYKQKDVNVPFLGVASTFKIKKKKYMKSKQKHEKKENPCSCQNTNLFITDQNTVNKTDTIDYQYCGKLQNNKKDTNQDSSVEIFAENEHSDSEKTFINNEENELEKTSVEIGAEERNICETTRDGEPLNSQQATSAHTPKKTLPLIGGRYGYSKNENQIENTCKIVSSLTKKNNIIESHVNNCEVSKNEQLTYSMATPTRRSSSSSNSSLKETQQQSINLKLKRRLRHILQDQKQSAIIDCFNSAQKHRRKRKKKIIPSISLTDSKKESNLTTGKARIKRIKFALNGEIATQRQISLESSSNNESDDEKCLIDDYTDTDVDCVDNVEEVREFRKVQVLNEESSGIRNAFKDDSNLYFKGDVYVTDNNQTINFEVDKYMVQKYCSVTEDEDDETCTTSINNEGISNHMSSTTTIENKHIVITIKKTPSKVSSPYGLLVCSENKGEAITELSDLNITKFDILKSKCSNSHDKYLESNSSQATISTTKTTKTISSIKTISKDETDRFKCSKKPFENKLHRQLFFPYELYTYNSDGPLDKILNISSCSSSCAEDEDEIESYKCTRMFTRNVSKSLAENLEFKNINADVENYYTQLPYKNCSKCKFEEKKSCIDFDSESSTETDSDTDTDMKLTLKSQENLTSETLLQNVPDVLEENKMSEESDLPIENNGLLSTFNNVYYIWNQKMEEIKESDYDIDSDTEVDTTNSKINITQDAECQKELKDEVRSPNENCDVYNKIFNNNNHLSEYGSNCSIYHKNNLRIENNDNNCKNKDKIINSKISISNNSYKCKNKSIVEFAKNNEESSTQHLNQNPQKVRLQPHKEYQLGMRAVDEDVNDEQGNNCARIQQFKEWHEVCQLRSYNGELLTVLPYVLLD